MAVIKLKENMKILFQGDSITDWGRSREDDGNLGFGYPMLISAQLGALAPHLNLKLINRAVGGDTTADMSARWTEDCVDLKPDALSIMIGVNDMWRAFDANKPTSPQTYYDNYRAMLERVKSEVGDIPLIILEPFVLPIPEDKPDWRADLDPKIHMTRRLAREYGAVYVPLDGIFAAKAVEAPPAYWSIDGVHPSARSVVVAR
ncbi:MAG: SGNH/GDSL hydrolase family protein, partial [Oscillospiraceae bacterium]|nr:SGNH/GDSL hydrolase family protein [Oscillospiraceae bacterium]